MQIEHKEEDFLFEKKYDCPICNKKFVSKTIRTGKARLVDTDMDLKPNYNWIEPIKYDVILCTHCGYAAVNRMFGHLTPMQIRTLREKIAANFCGIEYPDRAYYTFEEAEYRFKLALANAITIKMKTSECAYLYLKLAWLYRSYAKSLLDTHSEDDKVIKSLREKEVSSIKIAYDGLASSYANEAPPICGMDMDTITYLLADLARQCGDYDASARYVSAILGSTLTPERVKKHAREEKELLLKEMKN